MTAVPEPTSGASDTAVRPEEAARALHDALDAALDDDRRTRFAADLAAVAAHPTAVRARFPAAGRRYGRGPLPAGPEPWRVEDAVRAVWLRHLPLSPADLAAETSTLYREGDAAERRGVLLALPYLPVGPRLVELVDDAVRTNDPRLLAAALGPYAAHHLDQHRWRQAVLKCLFTGVSLTAVAELDERRDDELARMASGLAAERRAAGRPVPADLALLDAD